MALGADRESLALEISELMPNKSAVEGAIRYADRQKRRTLVQKLSEIAEEKLEEELKEVDEEEGVQEVIEIEESHHSHTRIRSDLLEVMTNDNISLKPKPIGKAEEDSNSRYNSDDSDSEPVRQIMSRQTEENSNEDSNSVTLKPKAVTFSKQSKVNPFKVTQKEPKQDKRKRARDSSDESDNESNNGFEQFYSDMKQIIRDENSDIDDEGELEVIGRRQFKLLDTTERKEWAKSGTKKRKAVNKECDTTTNKENAKNKITKFFTRN